MRKLCTIVLIYMAFAAPLFAASTIYGPTGLITVPTADSLRYKEFYFGFDYLLANQEDQDSYFYKSNLGTFENVEIGVVGGKVPTEGVFLNVKYYLMSDNSRLPLSIALGLQNLASNSDTSFYMVASKKFRVDWAGHIGFKAEFDSEELIPSIMGGTNYILNDQLELLADASGDGRVYTFNAAIQFYLLPSLMLRAAAIDIGQSTVPGTRAALGIAYSKFL